MSTALLDGAPVTAGVSGAPAGRTAARLDVLVLDAEFRQALASVRSFGRAGLAAGAVVCAPRRESALAHHSKWCRVAATVSDFECDADGYAQALFDLLDQHETDLLLPCHDGSIEAVRRHRAAFERRTRVALAAEPALDIAIDKGRTLALAATLGIAVPVTHAVTSQADLERALADVGLPAVLKPVASWVERDGAGTRLSCEPVRSVEEATRILARVQAAGGAVVVQQWLGGRRDAVTLLYGDGQIRARFAQISHRELPALGGATVLCESVPLLDDIVEPAERLVRAMALEGCSMVEFRRDRAGRPVLMEVNPRMAGSVALAIAAGVDFPSLLRAWALGLPMPAVPDYRVGVRRRWLAGDIDRLKSSLKSGRGIDVSSRLRTAGRFFADFVVHPAGLDVFAADDPAPGLIELRHTMDSAFASVERFRARARARREATHQGKTRG